MNYSEKASQIADRIRYLIDQQRLTQAAFARQLSVDPANMSKHLTGKLPITEGLINRIVVNFGVSKRWLVDGEDVPFARPAHATEVAGVNDSSLVPVYDVDVTAGSTELGVMMTKDRIIGAISLPSLNSDCSIVRVSGDSMKPVIKDGGYVAIRPINDMTNIFWGQIYVIVMDDYRMVKFLRRSQDDSKVILRSANSDYDDMEVPRDRILRLYLVESILNFELRC